MTWLRLPLWSQRRAECSLGDPNGLSRTPRDPARGRPASASLRAARPLHARGSPPRTPDTRGWARRARIARPVAPPSLPFNPHTVAPAPRFCPNDL